MTTDIEILAELHRRLKQAEETRDAAQAEATKQTLRARRFEARLTDPDAEPAISPRQLADAIVAAVLEAAEDEWRASTPKALRCSEAVLDVMREHGAAFRLVGEPKVEEGRS